MRNIVNWGILGTGNIASIFAKDLSFVDNANLLAVGSRTQKTANEFALKHNVERTYSSYSGLVADPDIDIIYIATPHTFHYQNSKLCLHHNKAVLCEKPFMVNEGQAREVFSIAKKKNLFVMEAMWTRFLPLMKTIRELINNGEIGELKAIHSDFCFYNIYNPESRLFNPDLAGGALLDVGIYPVMLAHTFFGEPENIRAFSTFSKSGVDENTSAIFTFKKSRIATFQSAVTYSSATEAVLSGTDGFMKIHSRWFEMPGLTLAKNNKEPTFIEKPFQGRGFHFEIAEAQRCLLTGKTESDLMPHKDTIEILRTLDRIREQVGLHYPFE